MTLLKPPNKADACYRSQVCPAWCQMTTFLTTERCWQPPCAIPDWTYQANYCYFWIVCFVLFDAQLSSLFSVDQIWLVARLLNWYLIMILFCCTIWGNCICYQSATVTSRLCLAWISLLLKNWCNIMRWQCVKCYLARVAVYFSIPHFSLSFHGCERHREDAVWRAIYICLI